MEVALPIRNLADAIETAESAHQTSTKVGSELESGVNGLLMALYGAPARQFREDWKKAGIRQALADSSPQLTTVDDGERLSLPDSLYADPDGLVTTFCDSWSLKLPFNSDWPVLAVPPIARRFKQLTDDLEALELADPDSGSIPDGAWVWMVRQTLRVIEDEFAASSLTEREFIAYHLASKYSSHQIADVLSRLYDSDIGAGTARKYNSRAEQKIATSFATLSATGRLKSDYDRVVDLPTLSAHPDSLLSDKVKTDIYRTLYWKLRDDVRENHSYWQVDDFTIEIKPDPSIDRLSVTIHYPLDALPQPVVVDEEGNEGSHQNVTHKPDSQSGSLTKFRSLSTQHSHTEDDISQAIEQLAGDSKSWEDVVGTPSLMATMAIYPEDDDDDGFVNFARFYELN